MAAQAGVAIGEATVQTMIIVARDNALADVLQAAQNGTPAPAAVGPNPYRSLAAFTEADAAVFFGRSAETAAVHARFLKLHEAPVLGPARPRMLTLLGPSGSGKSSLLRAGLIPALVEQPVDSKPATIVVMTPGTRPCLRLAEALAEAAQRQAGERWEQSRHFERELLDRAAAGKNDGLARIAEAMPRAGSGAPKRLILALDQLEEIYTQTRDADEREAFLASLIAAVHEPDGLVSAIASFRTDFLGQTAQHLALNALLTGADTEYQVPFMGPEALREAVARPAEARGYAFDPAFIDLVLKDVEAQEDGVLPALQLTLAQVWDALPGTPPAETLRRLGGVSGALASLGDEIYGKLHSDRARAIAKRAFLATVQLGEGNRDTRRLAAVRDIVVGDATRDEVLSVLRRFAQPDARLITLTGEAASNRVRFTVAHETLFSRWTQLRDWIGAARSDLRFLRRLGAAAERWDESGRRPDRLWFGADAIKLRELTHHPDTLRDKGLALGSVEQAFAAATLRRRARGRAITVVAVACLALLSLGLIREQYLNWVDVRPWGYLTDLRTGRSFDLRYRFANVGRFTDQMEGLPPDVAFPFQSVSRAHVQISRDHQLLDLRSTYGTTKNGGFIYYGAPVPIVDGDVLVFGGDTPARFRVAHYRLWDFLLPEKPRHSTPLCGWGVLVGERGGTKVALPLVGSEQGVRLDGGMAITAADDPQAVIAVRLLEGRTRMGRHEPVEVSWQEYTPDGRSRTLSQDVGLFGTDPEGDVYAVKRLHEIVVREGHDAAFEIRINPYAHARGALPPSRAVALALPTRVPEQRYGQQPVGFLSLIVDGARLQIIAYPEDAADAVPECGNEEAAARGP